MNNFIKALNLVGQDVARGIVWVGYRLATPAVVFAGGAGLVAMFFVWVN